MYRLPKGKQIAIMHQLVEGSSIRSTERLTNVHRDTIMRLGVKIGNQCREFLDREMRDLDLRHLQVDEIWTFCRKKQRRLSSDERDDPTLGDQYLYVALDQQTKLIPCFAVGKRTSEVTQAFMLDLAGRIVTPDFDDSLAFPNMRPQISTDAFTCYPDAVDSAFANTVRYGQLVKNYAETDQPGRYAPPRLTRADRRPIQGIEDVRTICTSHVERNNLTIRTFVRRFTRLSLGFSKKLENLAAAVALHVAYFNYCWRPRENGKSGRKRLTPAMMAGVTNKLWTVEDLYDEIAF